eukprot:14799818-Alexandrium_andersonii.AAC.1
MASLTLSSMSRGSTSADGMPIASAKAVRKCSTRWLWSEFSRMPCRMVTDCRRSSSSSCSRRAIASSE